jgi:hypothetical protein
MYSGIGKDILHSLASLVIAQIFGVRGQVALAQGIVDMWHQCAAITRELGAPMHQIPCAAHLKRVDVGIGNMAAFNKRAIFSGLILSFLTLPP